MEWVLVEKIQAEDKKCSNCIYKQGRYCDIERPVKINDELVTVGKISIYDDNYYCTEFIGETQ